MIIAVTNQYLYDFNRSWQLDHNYNESGVNFNRMVDYNQDGGLSALGFSYAIQILPSLSAGMTLNIWNDGIGYNHWEQDTAYNAIGYFDIYNVSETYQKLDEYSFSGENVNLGFLWNVSESITIGGVFKTQFTADVEHDENLYQILSMADGSGEPLWESNLSGSYDEQLEMPMSYGLGVSYRFSDELSFAFDLYRTEWDDMIYEDHDGERTSAISGKLESESDIKATMQARLGTEYLLIRPEYLIPIRGGFFYDPAPSEGKTDDFFGITVGTGYARGRWVFDVGYQFRFGSDVGSAIYKSGDLSQDVQEHTVYTSMIVHF